MNQPSTQNIIGLVSELILPFHEIKRTHKLPFGRRRLENDVEHSWSVATLACVLAPQIDQGLDVGKVAQFALVHDLVETFAGDTGHFTATESHRASKDEREHAALVRIQQEFASFPWLGSTIAEYETKESSEAQFVYAIDKYIAVVYDLLDKGEYLQQIGINKNKYNEMMASHSKKAHTHPVVGRYYDEIRELIDAQPEFLSS